MSKFKIGDKVVCVSYGCDPNCAWLGKEFVVTSADNNGSSAYIRASHPKHGNILFRPTELELVNRQENVSYIVEINGDKVECDNEEHLLSVKKILSAVVAPDSYKFYKVTSVVEYY